MKSDVKTNTLDHFGMGLVPSWHDYLSYKRSNNRSFISFQSFNEFLSSWKKAYALISVFQPGNSIPVNVESHASLRDRLQGKSFVISTFVAVLNMEVLDRGFIVTLPDEGKFTEFLHLSEIMFKKDFVSGCSFLARPVKRKILMYTTDSSAEIEVHDDLRETGTINKLYSRYCLRAEGEGVSIAVEIPSGSIASFMMYRALNISYILPRDFFTRRRCGECVRENPHY